MYIGSRIPCRLITKCFFNVYNVMYTIFSFVYSVMSKGTI